ncbi:molybdopterin-dependent oxidoreductase [Uliginosibacterium sp. H3]|uniref:Molybdopterin-dependent oxidoreductase n=1 Tax=Uliginosibacterium silvisoli TaxID=3114758 RepID=A0ABU6K739_9RHOO|nr:molybdopterin-dependent oxidoreductase [Uliginosibacterium sp. H3]
MNQPASPASPLETKSTCCYCGVGCGVIIEHDGQQITGVRGDPDHPANFGRLCTKGSTLHLTATPDSQVVRALYPELRPSREAPRARTDWDTALRHAADKFATVIREHGPNAVAFYVSGQLLTEDYYVFNKLAKGLIGTNNIDTNSRLCMSSAATGYKQTLGADSPPGCYDDLKHTDCLFLAGSNTAFAHPILFRRIEDARALNPAMKMIVVDPRRTDTAEQADLHLALLPGTDIALYNAMLHVMLWEEWIKPEYIGAHTEGFDVLRRTVREYTPAMAAEICGLTKKEIETAAEWFAHGGDASKATMSMYCMGLNQSTHGTHNNAALINLHLATAQIGKPGAGPFSLTGQPNAMGGREVGGMATLLSGHRDMDNAEHRAEVAKLWGIPSVPEQAGLTAIELFDAMAAGTVKAVWISCTNPAQSMPDQNLVRKALETCEFVVVQEAYRNTETARYADLLLPATSWGEKTGTVTNSERRISRVIQAVPAPGEARHDWDTAVDFARRLGNELGDTHTSALFPYTNEEDIWNEHRESTRGRDLDITGLSYATLEQQGPQQWPFPQGASGGKARLYEDGIYPTASGRAKFVATEHKDTVEKADARYPIRMTTGRLRDQWHGMSRTGTVARLYAHEAEPMIHMHAADIDRRGLKDGELVRVKSRRGEIVVKALASETVRPGQAFLPMHWGSNALGGLGTNALTLKSFDPYSKQPELKHSAVQISKYVPGDSRPLVAMRRVEAGTNALEVLEELRKQTADMPQAALTMIGRETPVVVLKAQTEALSADQQHALDVALSLADDTQCLSYQDKRRDIAKRARIDNNKLAAVRLTGEIKGAGWLQDMMVNGGTATQARQWLLAPLAEAPTGVTARGKIICSCFDVSENEISAALKAGESMEQVQARLKCGTNCGSCVPELKRLQSR